MVQSATKTNENYSFAKGELGAKASSPCFCGSSTQTYGENFFEMRDYWGTDYKFNAKELDNETPSHIKKLYLC